MDQEIDPALKLTAAPTTSTESRLPFLLAANDSFRLATTRYRISSATSQVAVSGRFSSRQPVLRRATAQGSDEIGNGLEARRFRHS